MIATPAGFLLEDSVFNESWFQVLAAIVAFNTLVYVGLSLSKLVPLPSQIHPSRVREWLALANRSPDPRSAVDEIMTTEPNSEADPYQRLRGEIARRDIPQAFSLLGGFIILMGVVELIAFGTQYALSVLIQFSAGVLMLFMSQILGRRDFQARTVTWSWVIASAILVGIAIADAGIVGAPLSLAYSLIIMVAFAPIAVAWRPALVGAAVMFLSSIIGSLTVPGQDDWRTITAAFVALVVGLILLHLRLSALDEISDAEARTRAVAATDSLTGLLTPNGLLSLMPTLGAIAEREDDHVCVMVFQIEDVAAAVHEYGIRYGKDLVVATAAAVQEHSRTGDLVAHWDRDRFVVAGLGSQPNADSVADRVQQGINDSAVSLGKWLPHVTVGTAAADPRVSTFDGLLEQAQQQMTTAAISDRPNREKAAGP